MNEPDISRLELEVLFRSTFGETPLVSPLSGGGSGRKYFRLVSPSFSMVGVWSNDVSENESFISLDRFFVAQGINVPRIFAVSEDMKSYLIQDLGDTQLLSLLSSGEKIPLAKNALASLLKIQTSDKNGWKKLVIHQPFSSRLVAWDLNYFKYCFLRLLGLPFDEEKLEDDFNRLNVEVSKTGEISGFMYRDFQSRNIMVYDNDLWFIDFQGGREGPLIYDLVSFLWQAKAHFSEEDRNILSDFYLRRLAELRNVDVSFLHSLLPPMVLFRTLQVLGAYGLRGLYEKKSHFVESIPSAVKNLVEIRNSGYLHRFPQISHISCLLEEKFNDKEKMSADVNVRGEYTPVVAPLCVTVYSFSYKKGYPEPILDNGGGFMFDCRAIHNPGRYQEFKSLTGFDAPVEEFLRKDGDAVRFVDKSLDLVSPSVKVYLRRHFTSLQVGFGCTGGQHRSVFCARLFANRLKKLFPSVEICVIHRERGVTEKL